MRRSKTRRFRKSFVRPTRHCFLFGHGEGGGGGAQEEKVCSGTPDGECFGRGEGGRESRRVLPREGDLKGARGTDGPRSGWLPGTKCAIGARGLRPVLCVRLEEATFRAFLNTASNAAPLGLWERRIDCSYPLARNRSLTAIKCSFARYCSGYRSGLEQKKKKSFLGGKTRKFRKGRHYRVIRLVNSLLNLGGCGFAPFRVYRSTLPR